MTTHFIPTQGNTVLAEQSMQKREINYKDTPFILLKEKFSSLRPIDGINNIISRNGKNNLEAINLFQNSKQQQQNILNATVEQLEIQKDFNNTTHRKELQEQIELANKKLLKPKYEKNNK